MKIQLFRYRKTLHDSALFLSLFLYHITTIYVTFLPRNATQIERGYTTLRRLSVPTVRDVQVGLP